VTGRSNHFTVVYNAGRAIGAEQPEALAYIALEFFERRDLFLVSRESGMAFPEGQERKFRDRPRCARGLAAVESVCGPASLDHGCSDKQSKHPHQP